MASQASARPEPPRCDYLISFATPSEKKALEAVATELGIPWAKQKSAHGSKFYDLGVLGASRVVAIQTDIGVLGAAGAISAAHFYLEKTHATGIISIGMAFGLSREHQSHGTVLVSEKLFPYDSRTVRPDGSSFKYVYHEKTVAVSCKPTLLRIFQQYDLDLRSAGTSDVAASEAENSLEPDATSQHPRPAYEVQFGVMLAGSAKVECTYYRDLLFRSCKQYGNLIGGEMEGFALLSLRKEWGGIVVKAISDFAEDEQLVDVTSHREQACLNAVRFVFGALRAWNPNA